MPRPLPSGHGWIPIANGALDVRDCADFDRAADVLVVPTTPSEAICLVGDGAALWRRLITAAPLPPTAVTPDEQAILGHLHDIGLVALGASHPARITELHPPTLSSPLHELVYALVARVAASHGIPCVFTKGPALHLQGLRDREHSGDVDLWCDPARLDELADALAPWGWHRAPDPWRGTTVHHTVTLVPEQWGCEIDVHRRFPGLVLDDDSAFALVLRDAVLVRYGAVDVPVPAPATHAVLAALHAVRPLIGAGPRSSHDSAAARTFLSRAEGSVARARELGAVPALRDELEPLAEPGSLDADAGGTPRDWVWRQQSDHVRAYWMAMSAETWPMRARLIVRFLWPPDDVALASAHHAGHAPTSARRARLVRLRRGIRDWMQRRR
ncbi:hypothetical protein QE410_000491 [Microbacterium sp. SORGH_AS 1204]|uniref:nucleotidyltransferase family protein n=1 Tax=Microbacterium sp. SORGH_AS_1204 TaxID=3041785 RepID=UPI00279001E0|nr:nucleotidyltransferase family protein [Microbacterium sp. SORGH_AS_1204]MDQ1135692.1 hypothetical protein [Microbacterium sp. SORGH_AS_1204]